MGQMGKERRQRSHTHVHRPPEQAPEPHANVYFLSPVVRSGGGVEYGLMVLTTRSQACADASPHHHHHPASGGCCGSPDWPARLSSPPSEPELLSTLPSGLTSRSDQGQEAGDMQQSKALGISSSPPPTLYAYATFSVPQSSTESLCAPPCALSLFDMHHALLTSHMHHAALLLFPDCTMPPPVLSSSSRPSTCRARSWRRLRWPGPSPPSSCTPRPPTAAGPPCRSRGAPT